MDIKFSRRHCSITEFPQITLPKFAVIVGENGAGKSHFLQAILNGSLKTSLLQYNTSMVSPDMSSIKLITSVNLENPIKETYSAKSKNDLYEVFSTAKAEYLSKFYIRIDRIFQGNLSNILNGEDLWCIEPSELIRRSNGVGDIAEINEIFLEAENELMKRRDITRHSPPQQAKQIEALNDAARISQVLGVSILRVMPYHLRTLKRWGSIDQFSMNITLIFGNYRDAWRRNNLLGSTKERSGYLRESEFLEVFGVPPWEQINQSLREFDLSFEFEVPDLIGDNDIVLSLRSTKSGVCFKYEGLSSGEKIILHLVLSSFSPDKNFVNIKRPVLIMMDEIDGALHPRMTSRWIGALLDNIVEKNNINCIITTHSPVTVALCPDGSIFEILKSQPGLRRISKQEALNKLTFGLPTLAINPSGRRQVFTESDNDAAIYEKLYNILKASKNYQFELNFLSTGTKSKRGESVNQGCSVVRAVVEKLHNLGNLSVFGVVDWDGIAHDSDRVKVIAYNERNGIENVILDPLLVALLLMKNGELPQSVQGINKFRNVGLLCVDDLQRLANVIQTSLFPHSQPNQEVLYSNGISIKVIDQYLKTDDHVLENMLISKFPYLKRWHGKGSGALMLAVVEHVLSEYEEFCPSCVDNLFASIANC